MALKHDAEVSQAERQFTGAWFEGWTLFPQDASGDLQLAPFTSKLCMHCNWICIVLAIVTHMFFEYSETIPCARHTIDESMPGYFNMTAKLAFAGLCYESLWFVCIRWMGLASLYRSEMKLRKRLRLNVKMIWVFSMLTSLYHLMSFDMQYVHDGWLARYHGGHQLVYTVRYLEWTVCAPVVLSVNGQLDNAPNGAPRNGMIPSALLTGIYCIISWQGLVVQNAVMGWVLVGFAFFCYVAASVEQLYLASYFKDKADSGPVKVALLVYLVVMMGIYGIWYLLPIPGWMSTTLENKLYCFGDASFKLGTNIMLIVTEDVCAVIQMRQRAQVLAKNLENLVNTASVPIIGVDRSGKITEVNVMADKLLRRDDGESLVGQSLYDLVVKQDREGCEGLVKSALDGEQTSDVEVSLMRQGAQRCPTLDLSASCRKDFQTGDIVGATLVGHDITSLREAEERKFRFMATISHELRSPLHGIIGLSEHLTKEETDETKSHNLAMITSCSKRMLTLVVDIMDMANFAVKRSGGGSGKQVLHKDPVDLSKIVEEVVTLTERSTDKQGRKLLKPGVRLINLCGARMPIIEADAAKCNQVMLNLVTNACKFTSEGSITVTSKVLPGGDHIEVAVADTGVGISQESIERVFAPFEQEDNSLGRSYEGIGLGLAIANHIVKMHGGRIDVSSELGRGTTFRVCLPVRELTKVEEPEEVAPPAVQSASHQQEPARRPTNELPRKSCPLQLPRPPDATRTKPVILSVDDDPVNQMIMERLLTPEYDIQKAMDGEEACAYLKKNPMPDAVLLDSMMPGLSGPEVVRIVRQELNVSSLDLPILMVSASDSPDAVIEALDLGANDYIGKPFQANVLQARLRAALRARGQHLGQAPAAAATDDMTGILGTEEGLRNRTKNMPSTN